MADFDSAQTSAQFRVVKTNKRGKSQNRVIELNFTDGRISSINTRGKVQKSHHASKVMFAEKVADTMLVLHFPDKKDYKLNFVAPEDREMFCAKLVDLCKTCKVNTVEPLQEVMFDPTKHATFESESAGKASFTFRVKMAGMDGLALVLNAEKASSDTAQAHKVKTFYPFSQIRSWENHGEFLIIEVSRGKKNAAPGAKPLQVKVKSDEATCNAILKAIHTCITRLMEKKKADKAAKKAGKASEKEAPKPVSQAERFRRASLVVDVAAMATFEEETGEPPSRETELAAQGGVIPGGASSPTTTSFVARRQSVLAETNRRASLIAGVAGVMGAAGGGSEADMMAAAVAATDMEDTFDSAGESGGKVMADVVGVLADEMATTNTRTEDGIRRMSLMADVSGESNPAQGASLLLDLAAFVEEGEDMKGAGFDKSSAFATIGEGNELEEDSEEDDFLDGSADVEDDFDDVDILGRPSGDTDLI